ncbi:MAG TPA: hypothetical protein G4O13_05775 [Dehalococcoidia bacterium]|nr:hypothetical protein [Dehalococcoidia bacterium]
MTEQICPVCGCTIEEGGYEKEGVTYCCEPCADGTTSCECSCCHQAHEEA